MLENTDQKTPNADTFDAVKGLKRSIIMKNITPLKVI